MPEKEKSENRYSNIPPVLSMVMVLILIWLTVIFFNGQMYRFYASLLFFYYSQLGKMWWAVIGLGITQTLLLIPLRVIRLLNQSRIQEFKKRTLELEQEKEQTFYIKKSVRKGDRAVLFYTVDFFLQLTTYLTIGRLFLTDFYSVPLNPRSIYSFIPYPKYPIQGTMFKIPYIWFSRTINLGWKNLLLLWLVLMGLQLLVSVLIWFYRNLNGRMASKKAKISAKYTLTNLGLMFLFSYLIVFNFPAGWELKIFSGSITRPNRTFNTITAISTSLTLIWFGYNRIRRESKKAREQGMDEEQISLIQKKMFGENLRTALLVGLGAFFITNQIPSAFELSIFTFEIISLASPLTLDKLILKSVPAKSGVIEEK